MSEDTPAFERFVALAKRELGADDVRLLAPSESAPEAPNVLVTRMDDGRHVVASFGEPPKDRDALERRLTILTTTFAESLAAPPSEKTRARPRVASSLHEELRALAVRARARDCVVIDVDSPVVWGSASVPAKPRARSDLLLRDVSDRELASQVDDESGPLQDVMAAAIEPSPYSAESPAPAESSPMATSLDEHDEDGVFTGSEPDLTRRAIAAMRNLPGIDSLHKGRHLRHVERERDFYLALSFSGIYLLCIVFDAPFDELRAEKSAHESLPRIERLVQALPPLDPEPQPMGGVVAFRRTRRR
jgi:hypothetical protein